MIFPMAPPICLPDCLWPFSPGVFIAILGAVAAVATFFSENSTKRQKALWILSFLILMALEIWMIRIDRKAADKKQEEMVDSQLAQFSAIRDNIKESIKKTDQHFDETLGHVDTVLQNITGGDSFAYLIPELLGVTREGYLTFAIENKGSYPLTGVTVSIVQIKNPTLVNPDSYIGTLSPHERRMTHILIRPDFSATDGIDTYDIDLAAQNHSVSQILQIRKSKDPSLHYAVRYWVTKAIPSLIKNGTVAGITKSWEITPTRWSDEPKEHK